MENQAHKRLARSVNILFMGLVLAYLLSMATLGASWVALHGTQDKQQTHQDSINKVLVNQKEIIRKIDN